MDEMNITNAQYISIDGKNVSVKFEVDGELSSVSLESSGNRHYEEIMRQVKEGTLTIKDAD
tara:strand:+ start:487 stop:669 length:183 start_codon:yes stop_codon:yes gene_type:complete